VSASAADASPLRSWLGIAAFYAASFAVLGVYMQFFPVWLHDERGLSPGAVTVVMAAQTIARTIAGPLWSKRVDRTQRPRRVLMQLATASFCVFLLFGVARAEVALWACAFLFGCLYSPMHPIADTVAMAAAARNSFAYGRLRLVGSTSFLVVVLVAGWWLARTGHGAVFGMLVVGLLATVGASALLPVSPAPQRHPEPAERAPIGSLLRSGSFVLLLASAALIQGSHQVYYSLSTVHWARYGIGSDVAGALWAEGVLAEIVLFFIAAKTVDRLRATTMIMIGGFAAVVRWMVLGECVSVPVLAAANWLHGLSFSCTYLGSLRAIERRVPVHQHATAQGLLGASTSGVGMVVCGLLGGYSYESWAGRVFFLMAAFAGVGIALAWRLRRKNAYTATRQLPATTASRPE
jgi:PPP family 3-phenylpropionic acid transporter